MLRPKPPKAAGAAEVVAGATAAAGAGVGATVAVVALGAPNPGFVVQCSMGFFGIFFMASKSNNSLEQRLGKIQIKSSKF